VGVVFPVILCLRGVLEVVTFINTRRGLTNPLFHSSCFAATFVSWSLMCSVSLSFSLDSPHGKQGRTGIKQVRVDAI
jgi:hypothetical protein